MRMPVVYIETSIVSYLRLRPSNHIVSAARQLLTQRWWDTERQNYNLVTSQFVLDEASQGNPELAIERLRALDGISLLDLPPDIAHRRRIVVAGGSSCQCALGRIAYCSRGLPRCRLPVDVELLAYCECAHSAAHSRGADGAGPFHADHLHTGGNGR